MFSRVRDGQLVVVVGASRSGKTQYVRRRLVDAPRVLVWDPKAEYHELTRIRDLPAWLNVCLNTRVDSRAAYVPGSPRREFSLFCDLAWHYCRFAAPGSILVVDELADVSHAGKAPDSWGTILRQGLGYGVDIYAITQRPQESDKTSMGNASALVCCRLARADDRRYMANELDVPVSAIQGLSAGRDSGDYLVRYAGNRARRGRQHWQSP
jgi:hypothetical protein